MVHKNWSLVRDFSLAQRACEAEKIKQLVFEKVRETREFTTYMTENCYHQYVEITMSSGEVYAGYYDDVQKEIERRINVRVNELLGL
jgi:hypothetical protein